MSKKDIIRIIILTAVLTLISFIVIIIKGNTYELKVKVNNNVKDINELKISIDDDNNSVKLIKKDFKNKELRLLFESKNKGIAFIEVNGKNHFSINKLFVHKFGIMTLDRRLGKCSGDIVVPISILLIITEILFIEIKYYKQSIKENLYKYKNMTYLSVIIFLGFMFLNQLFQILDYNGLADSVELIINSVDIFARRVLPLIIIVTIIAIISNFKLLKREGITWRNMLGFIIAIIFILPIMVLNIFYSFFENSIAINIYDKTSVFYYLLTFIELCICGIVSYLECLFFANIILAYKAAKKTPEFNKDYMIILGCKIRKDGSITPLLKGRIDKALEFAKKQKENNNKDIIFIPSGGQGNDETISEAEAINKYLLDQGISKKQILLENKSTNTYENIKFSYNLIKKRKNYKDKNNNIAFSTTNYHVFRAGNIAFKQNLNIEGVGANTKAYFWINAFIREFIATFFSEKRSIYKVIRIIIILEIIITIILFIVNK